MKKGDLDHISKCMEFRSMADAAKDLDCKLEGLTAAAVLGDTRALLWLERSKDDMKQLKTHLAQAQVLALKLKLDI